MNYPALVKVFLTMIGVAAAIVATIYICVLYAGWVVASFDNIWVILFVGELPILMIIGAIIGRGLYKHYS
jgi:hypothetical protein